MIHKIKYLGRRSDGHILFINVDIREALQKGPHFESNGYELSISESDELAFCMHRHCPHLDIKLNPEHNYTIKELYHLCPAVLLDLLELNGGVDYIAQLLIGYEELYNQEQIKKQWQENQQQ